MFIAMNRFRIHLSFEATFEERWKQRRSALSESPGFQRFRLLRSRLNQEGDEILEYVSYTEWLDKPSFEAWLSGGAARQAHALSDAVPRAAYAGPPEFRGYEVLLDEVPGHRTDFRSVALDLKVEALFARESPAQREIAAAHARHNLPRIHIGPFEGRLLEILLRANGARRGVELGTLGAYSSTWIARALPAEGRLITIEKSPDRAAIARRNLEQAGLSAQVEVRVGEGLEVLASLDHLSELDFVFIDADKRNYGNYMRWAMPRLRPGGLLLADNAYIWGGMHYLGRDYDQVPLPEREGFSPEEFAGMSDCWREFQAHPEFASLILPTGEGLGVAVKLPAAASSPANF